MKVSLIFPTPSDKYNIPWSTEKINMPLQSGLAVLASNIGNKIREADVKCIGNQIVSGDCSANYTFRYRPVEEFVELCNDSDIVGVAAMLINLEKGVEISRKLKKRNPKQKIIFGGPEVSNLATAKLLMQQEESVDCVVMNDGEQSIADIINDKKPTDIPNLVYRRGSEITKSPGRFVSDYNSDIWNFTDAPDYADTMMAFDSRTELYAQLRKDFGNFMGMVGVGLSKGCEKAEQMGRCSYCASAQNPKVMIGSAMKFWQQILHLYGKHGINEYFIVDNILATPKKLDALIAAKKQFDIPEDLQFRGYGYVPFFYKQGGIELMGKLQDIGVRNLFLGVENFDPNINQLSNKPGFTLDEVVGILEQASQHGLDTFVPIIVGLPGDSSKSLELNLQCVHFLLERFGSKRYNQGRLSRVDLSMAMPLRGTPWFNQLTRIPEVLRFYKENTGKDLMEHLTPDYNTLRDASLRFYHSTGLTESDLEQYRQRFIEKYCEYLRPEQVGGFEPTEIKKI